MGGPRLAGPRLTRTPSRPRRDGFCPPFGENQGPWASASDQPWDGLRMTWERFFDDVLPVVLPVLSALLTLWLSQLHSRRSARDQRESDSLTAAKARSFDARQNRYGDRLDAVVEFLAAEQKEVDSMNSFYREAGHSGPDPIDVYEDYEFVQLNSAHARLSLLGDRDVVVAADQIVKAVRQAFNGEADAWERLVASRAKLMESARQMLVSDADRDN